MLPDLPAELLLQSSMTMCFAVGGALGEMSVNTVCTRVVKVMLRSGASEAAWRVARVVAAGAGRYEAFMDAIDQVRTRPPLTDDLVRYGIDVGYRRGKQRGLLRGRAEGRAEGRAQGRAEVLRRLRRALRVTYEARFGTPPPEIVEALRETKSPEALIGLQAIFATRSARGIAAALRRRGQG